MEFLSVNGTEYQILKLLGKGKGGYSYLVTDGVGQYTLKQIHHEPCDYYQFGDKLASELADHERLRAVGILMPRLLDVDREEERILKEYIQGDTIYQKVLDDQMEPDYFRQVEEMCVRRRPEHRLFSHQFHCAGRNAVLYRLRMQRLHGAVGF